jgi:hypothetical protein
LPTLHDRWMVRATSVFSNGVNWFCLLQMTLFSRRLTLEGS